MDVGLKNQIPAKGMAGVNQTHPNVPISDSNHLADGIGGCGEGWQWPALFANGDSLRI